MDATQYYREMAALLDPVPQQFHGFIESYAYDRGHSAGYEEVLNIAGGLVSDLLPAIKAYDASKEE